MVNSTDDIIASNIIRASNFTALFKNRWCIKKYAEVIKENDSQSKMIYLRL